MREWSRRRVRDAVRMLIRQGITPEKIAMSIALGVVLGTVPILGITTVLCAAAAVAFRLNVAAVQLANWLACPLQIVLLIPFFVMGGYLFGTPTSAQDAAVVVELFRSDLFSALGCAAEMTFYAVLAWLLIALPVMFILYRTLLFLLARLPEGNE